MSHGTPLSRLHIEGVADGLVVAVHAVLNPDKLAHLMETLDP